MRIWKDPVCSKLISVAFLVIITTLGTWLLGLWPQIKTALLYGLSYKIVVPVWKFIVMVLILIFLVAVLQQFKKNSGLNFLEYKNDKILDIEWSWTWSSPNRYNGQYSIRNLHCRCPNCKSTLELNNHSGQLVHCINDECNWQWEQHGISNNRITHDSQLKHKVQTIIDRKIYNREF